MNRNILYRLYAAAFVGMCLVPSVLMPFVKNSGSKEKRQLAEMPKVKTDDGRLNTEFFDRFDSYFSEHFALRQQFVDMDGRWKAALLGTSANSDVIVGKDGWLYYGETADDFMNINTLSDRAIENIRHNLELLNGYCQSRGVQFIFTSAPNKNSLYPGYMPFNYIESDNKDNYERLSEALDGSGFYCDMKKVLKSANSNIPLYHKTDTHWNNLGAYVGHTGLMDMADKESCPVGTSWFTRNDRLGDLAAMLYPAEGAKDTQVYNDYEYTYQYKGRFHGLDDITINTVCEGKEGSLLMFRDSYGEAILPYMAECFGNAEFSRVVPYRMDGVDNIKDGTVILEIVERNIGDLQKYAPVMEAPAAANVPDTFTVYDKTLDIRIENSGKYTHIYGELPEEFFAEGSSRILVSVAGTFYEAFNCFEGKLLDRANETSDRGYSLYVPSVPKLNNGDITIISVRSDGRSVKYN